MNTNRYYFLFYLLLHVTMTFHFMNSTPEGPDDRKVTTTNCILHKSQGILPFAVRMSRFKSKCGVAKIKADISSFRILPRVLQCSLNSVST